MTAKKAKTDLDIPGIQRMLKLFKQRRDEDAALIDEIERLIGGGPGIGEILKERYACWNELWSQNHGGNYVFTFHIDAPQMKRLVRELGVEELDGRMFNYLKDRDSWLMQHKHPFAVFVKQNNRYATTQRNPTQEMATEAVGCKHQPPCRSDQEHTKKVMQEHRA